MAYKSPGDMISMGIHQAPSANLSIQDDTEFRQTPDVQVVSPTSSTRRRSTIKMPGLLKRAVSSPNVRSVGGSDNLALSAADKKRNKLGYHRTAVACGHCRRRKIRCIPAFEDTSGRCQNCIRLKKDCHFFPVDQQTAVPGKKGRSGSKGEVYGNEGETSVSSSSPGVLGSSSIEQIDQVNSQINTPPMPQGSPGFQSFPGSGGLVNRQRFMHPRELEYQQNQETIAHHMNQYPGQFPRGLPADRTHFENQIQYGHPQESQILHGSFPTSPYTTTPISNSITNTPQDNNFQFPQHSPPTDFTWAPHPPVRSMSIADADDLTQTYAAYRAEGYPAFGRRMKTAPELSQLPSMNNNLMSIPPEMQHIPVTVGTGYQEPISPYHQMHPQSQWVPMSTQPQQPVLIADSYGQPWVYHSMPTTLTGVREEETQHGISNHPPQGKAFRAIHG